jgi:hypothetical protein
MPDVEVEKIKVEVARPSTRVFRFSLFLLLLLLLLFDHGSFLYARWLKVRSTAELDRSISE